MAKAPVIENFTVAGYEDVTAGIVKWPLSVIRLQGKDTERIIDLAEHILNKWRGYTDEEASSLQKLTEHHTARSLRLQENVVTCMNWISH